MTLDEWIEREFTGRGLVIRRKEDPPIEGEPVMSMAIAKDLTRRAVTEFALVPSPSEAGREEAIREMGCPNPGHVNFWRSVGQCFDSHRCECKAKIILSPDPRTPDAS